MRLMKLAGLLQNGKMVKMPKFTIVDLDDWVGIYQDGEIIYQDHSIDPYWLLDHFGIEYNEMSLNDDGLEWMLGEGYLPDEISGIPEEYIDSIV